MNVACWSCGAERAPTDALCPSCGKVQPPPALKAGEKLVLDKFATLGVPRAFEQDDAALEEVRRLLAADPVDGAKAADLLARMRYYARYLDEVEGRGPEL